MEITYTVEELASGKWILYYYVGNALYIEEELFSSRDSALSGIRKIEILWNEEPRREIVAAVHNIGGGGVDRKEWKVVKW